MKSFLIAEILGLHDELTVVTQTEKPAVVEPAKPLPCLPDETQKPEADRCIESEKYHCGVCSKQFSEIHQLNYHARLHDRNKCCPTCGEFFRSKSKFKAHLRMAHSIQKFQCDHCEKRFRDKWMMMKHRSKNHDIPIDGRVLMDSSFENDQKSKSKNTPVISDIDHDVSVEIKLEPFNEKAPILAPILAPIPLQLGQKVFAKTFFKNKILQRYNESVQTSM